MVSLSSTLVHLRRADTIAPVYQNLCGVCVSPHRQGLRANWIAQHLAPRKSSSTVRRRCTWNPSLQRKTWRDEGHNPQSSALFVRMKQRIRGSSRWPRRKGRWAIQASVSEDSFDLMSRLSSATVNSTLKTATTGTLDKGLA